MSVGILLIGHNHIANAMLDVVKRMFGSLPLQTRSMDIDFDADTTKATQSAQQLLDQIDSGDGVLILVDLAGATPCNTLQALKGHRRIVSGINLPMLIRIYNYSHENLEHLTALAIEGGHRGIKEEKNPEYA